jgi:hypothetical protein
MHRTVRRVYAVAVALFWLVGAAVAVVMHTAVVIAAVVIFALLDAGAIWFAFRDARAGIRRNTVPQALDGHNVGL